VSKAGIFLRPAVVEDAPALTACIDAAYQGYRNAGIDLPPVADGIAEDIRDNHAWVAEDAQGIVGGAVLIVTAEAAKMANVAVHPNRAGQGIGRLLMDCVLDAAEALGHSRITLVTHRDMPDNIALYEHLGFTVDSHDGAKIHMTRPLP